MDAALFGLIVADVVAEPIDTNDPPPAGGLKLIDSIQLTTGGSVCNVGVAMARLGLSVAACGMIGHDLFGRAILEQLTSAQINTDSIFVSDVAPTSATIVAVARGGERTFFHTRGATPLLDAPLFRKCFATFRQCAWLHIGYFGLLPGLAADLPELLAEFRQTAPGTKIALDTVNPPGDFQQLAPILPYVDVFAPSRAEAKALTGQRDPSKMVAHFRRHMPGGLIGIKLDSDGCILDDGAQRVVAPANKVRVVDTTGAGDTWFAGLLVAMR
jgi:sugar/nucleoside kinase (ribokinase family)